MKHECSDSSVYIYDTTLRDGTQRKGMSLTRDDKLEIARQLDALGVAYVEGGWPGSNPKDIDFFEAAKDLPWENAALAAFGSTRRPGRHVEEDEQIAALLRAATPVCTLFGKSSRLHVEEVLRTSFDENLLMIEESVRFLVDERRRVIYDAEHFFDGWKADSSYAYQTLEAAVRGGADTLVLCDTNGGSFPWEVEEVVREIRQRMPKVTLGIHGHDDSGCGVANAIAAVRGGARHVQGTLNGYGERCGNSNLSSVVPNLQLKLGHSCVPSDRLKDLGSLSRTAARITEIPFDEHMPFFGANAFAHKGGVHVAAVRRNPASYEHCDPSLLGNESQVVVSELAGRASLLTKVEEWGVHSTPATRDAVLGRIKRAEFEGCSFDAAEGSAALLVTRESQEYAPLFEVLEYRVNVVGEESKSACEATVRVRVGDEVCHTAADGDGPVHALDQALRRALLPRYPKVASVRLEDYGVTILNGVQGTSSKIRVLIEFRDVESTRDSTWGTVGASRNILQASLSALVDGIEFGLIKQQTPNAVPPSSATPSHGATS